MKKVQFLFAIVSFFLILGISSLSAHAKNITVVIDPGHGGENLGGTYGNFIEKEMTLKTAYAMKDHLEQYDDV
ncbi:MAG: N-acetylmuramoyl-L-alanine amidase, partial [Lachnospiraceae bacterium]